MRDNNTVQRDERTLEHGLEKVKITHIPDRMSGRVHERRTSVHKGKSYNSNKGIVSKYGSDQSGEWRLIRD